jgi:hypothetical protein
MVTGLIKRLPNKNEDRIISIFMSISNNYPNWHEFGVRQKARNASATGKVIAVKLFGYI